MKKVGILGGSFNPIHYGHLLMAQSAYEQAKLDKVLIMPLKTPPHKNKDHIISDYHRMNMINIAIKDNPNFEASDFELKRDGTTYTADTLTLLHKENPGNQYYFIMGADSYLNIQNWREPQIIFNLCTILVINRDEESFDKLIQHSDTLYKTFKNVNILYIDMPNIGISSTDIRDRIKEKQSIRYLLPKEVNNYIMKSHLYVKEVKASYIDADKIKSDLEKNLSESSYNHIISTADVACNLAKNYGYDDQKAYIAALLHDCAKYLSDDELMKICRDNHITITDIESINAQLLHSKVGAFWATDKYNIIDTDILNAILYHTTARADMSELEKIIFIADYIEPTRKPLPRIAKIREMAFESLDSAVLLILENTLNYLNSSKADIDNTTMIAYDYYK